MAKYLPLPDGSSLKVPDSMTYDEAMARAQVKFPDLFPKAAAPKAPEESLFGSAVRGTKSMIGSEQTGLASLLDANKAATEGLARQQKIAAEHPSEDSWEKVKKAYQEQGLLSAVGEYGRQIPYAIAEQAPQIAQARLGAAAGAASPIPGGALAGAFAPAFAQQYGGFLEEQAKQQQEKGQPVDVSRLKAAAAAVPAAAIDVLETFVPMGKSAIKSMFPGVAKLLERGATQEAEKVAMRKLADESFLKTLGKGTARGAAVQVPGEVVQQMLQRAQSGQSLFDENALADYGKTAFQTTQLGPLGAVGRFQDRSAARTGVQEEKDIAATQERVAKAKETEAAQAAQEAHKQTPAYAMDIESQYQAAEQAKAALRAQIKPITKGSETETADKEHNKAIGLQLKEQEPALRALGTEFNKVKPVVEQMRAQEAATAEQARLAGMSPEEYAAEQAALQPQGVKAPKRVTPVEGDPFAMAEQVPPPAAYVAQRFELLSQQAPQVLADPKLTADYLMQDPEMARQVLAMRTPMPGMKKRQSENVLYVLGNQLKERDALRAAQGQAGTAAGAQRIGTVEEEEQAALAAQRGEEARLAQEAEANRAVAAKVAPEMAALQRMKERPSPTTQGMAQFQNQPAPPSTSPAIGQMQQELLGIPQEKRTLPTAEVAQADRTRDLRRVPGAEFKLRPDQGAPFPINREGVADRLNYVLSTYDLSPEAVAFLQRVEKTLPQKLDEDYAAALDAQLAKIESGEEGVPRKGVSRTEQLQTFPAQTPARAETAAPTEAYKYEREGARRITGAEPGQATTEGKAVAQPADEARRSLVAGEAPVEKRVSATTAQTLRGPSAKAADLSLQEDLTPYLTSTEQAAAETEGQGELFPGEGRALAGVAKEDRAAFERFMNSPYVRKLQKAVRENPALAETPLEGKAAERAQAGAAQAQRRNFVQELSTERSRLWNAFLSGKSAETGTQVRALTQAEREAREKGLTSDAAKEVQYANELYNKPLKWLEQELGKVHKKVAEMEKIARAARQKSGTYVGGVNNVIAFPHMATAIRVHANASARIESLENAIEFRQAQDAARVTERKPRTVTPDTKNAALLGDAFAVLKNKPAIQGKASAVSRSTSAAPTALRTGTKESAAGKTSTPVSRKAEENRTVSEVNREINREEMRLANEEAARMQAMSKREKARAQKEAKEAEKVVREMRAAEDELDRMLSKKRSLYRTATGAGETMETKKIESLTQRITAGWVNAPKIKVVASEKGLPVRILTQLSQDEKRGKVPGLYDTTTKTVYLIADALHSANDVIATIAHEAAGHHGLRELFGATYTQKMDDIFDGNTAVRKQAKAKMEAEPNLSQQIAVEEVLAEMAEKSDPTPEEKTALQRIYAAIKQWMADTFGSKYVTDEDVQKIVADARKYVIEGAEKAEGQAPAGEAVLRTKEPKYANDGLAGAGEIADRLIAKQRTVMDTVKTEGLGLGLATRLIDRFAPLERISKLMDSLKGTQMMYYARMYDQRMNFVAQSVGNGANQLVEKTRADGRKEWVIESKEGASLKGVVDILKTAPAGSPEANSRLFSLYLAAKRADRVGLNKLNFGAGVTQADLDSAMAAIKATPGLDETFADAQREYNMYNKGLMQFAVDTGALSKEAAAEMTKANDYVPYYRANNGSIEMVLGKETITRVGNLKEQPYLQELVGGSEQILDFMTSSVQNTNMMTDMALRNLATKNAVHELRELGMATIGKGSATSGPDVVKFKEHGEERFAIVDTKEAGFPGELLVKGLEGIPTQTTWLTKAMGGPARVLRKAVVLNPLYAARQIFRDSLAAPLLSGADFAPVMGALKEIGKPAGKTLEQRGITGGQVFTGTQEDLTKILRDMSANKPGWAQGMARLEAMSMEADALTRRAQYNSYIKQGLSEMEATFMALESMNFSKRGASPAMHTLATVIPFFNAQVQSLNVLYKALSGNMPFNEKLKIREKLLARGMVVAGMSMLYAALMQDDETYKNATPDQKYGNWFIHVPGVEEAVRIPIPFEVGYIFKALPEAIVNTMMSEHGGEDAAKAFKQIALQLIPGGTSWGIPQALKPALEVALGKSTFTGRDLESAHEQMLTPGQRVRDNTSALSAQIGSAFNVSPIKIDALIQGYTSTMGLAFVQALSFAVPTPPAAEKPTGRMSELPVVGSLFQPKDAGGIISAAYDRMKEAEQVKNTYNDMLKKGKGTEAREFLQNNLEQFALSGLATNFTSVMQSLGQAERAIRASDASPEQKRERLDELRQRKIKIAEMAREAGSEKTTPR